MLLLRSQIAEYGTGQLLLSLKAEMPQGGHLASPLSDTLQDLNAQTTGL